MSAFIYPYALGGLENGDLVWESLNVRALLLSQSFVYNPALQFRDEIDESFVIATSSPLESPLRIGNVVTGLPFTWLQLADNRVPYHVVLFDDTGDDPYSSLISYHGSDKVDGLPVALQGANYYLFPVNPPGGFFSYGTNVDAVGMLGSYGLADPYALAETEGGTLYSIPTLVFGLDLDVNERICLLPDVVDSDECCRPTIRSSRCA